jgi:glycosyltransferase involved in cell wall biosynthesis
MKSEFFVTVIVPCRNEIKYISKSLDSIILQDYPKNKLEVLVVDGFSEDGTREILKKYIDKYSFIKIIDNPKKIASSAMNIGIKKAKGDIIIRMDAHNIYEKDYIKKCVKYLYEYNADNVGGIWITLPGDNSIIAKSIALVLSHPFGIGNSYFRRGVKEVKEVDTVPFGCYKKEVFEKIGLFNENLIRNQDIEFNLRLKRSGGKILLVPDIISYYYARPNLKSLFKQNFLNGYWVVYSLKYANMPFSYRHLIPFSFILFIIMNSLITLFYRNFFYLLVALLFFYGILDMFFSLSLSIRHGLKYLPFLFITFPTLHFSYGLGSLWGLIKLIFSKLKISKNDKFN